MTEKLFKPFNKIEEGYTFYLLSIYASVLILFTRRPDVFQNPQFWAEDGKIWYEQAYHQGLFFSLTTPVAGYLQTICRLVATFSQLFPLAYAPLIFNLTAIVAKVLVVQFILSKRLTNCLPALWMRLLVAFLYLAVPHSYEAHGNLTNVQWHLALLSCFIIISTPAATKLWKTFDFIAIVVSTLSGPFCLFLLPIALIKYYYHRNNWILTLIIVMAGGCIVQGISILAIERPSRAALGANINRFLLILGGQVFFSTIFGETGFFWTYLHPFWKDSVAVIINLIGLGLFGYAAIKSNLELRLLMLFAVFIMVGALVYPAASNNPPQWDILFYPLAGTRYWMIPIFCCLVVLCWIARSAPHKIMRLVATVFLLLAPIGICLDWQYTPYKDYTFQKYVYDFDTAPSGTEVKIPTNPPNWEMNLKKK